MTFGFTLLRKRLISLVTGLCVLGTAVLAPASAAFAQSSCSSAITPDQGWSAQCGGIRLNSGVVVGYAKIQWQAIASVGAPSVVGSGAVIQGDQTVVMANRAARALGISADQVATAVQTYPANVPMVIGRYNPADATLMIDIFRLDKQGGSATLMHATFTPQNGDIWKANRAYIDPASRTSGAVAGINPFLSFMNSANPSEFANISINGAQVAMGHAMRLVGAGVGIMSVVSTSFTQTQTTSGGWFHKTVRVWTYGHAQPVWYIAMPTDMARSTSFSMAAYCANDPSVTSCALYQTATAGVVFEQFTGGTLSDAEDTWLTNYQESGGWTFLAFIGLALLVGVPIAVTAKVVGLLDGPASLGGGVSGIAPSVGDGTTTIQAGSELGGARFGVTGQNNPTSLYQQVATVSGTATPPTLTSNQATLDSYVAPTTTSNFATGGATLTGFSQTIYGGCPVGSTLAACGGSSGFTPRTDQYSQTNEVTFMRDNAGNVIRDVTGQ